MGVLVLAGSSGRLDDTRAELLARHGAVAESVQWFGAPGQHGGPWEIPLELFLARVDELLKECDRIVVMGTSFGSEAALLTGVHSPAVSAVVVLAPSDVVWAGIRPDGEMTSHWTLGGDPLPYVPFVKGWEPVQDPPAFREFYRLCRARHPQRAVEAQIPVERIAEVLAVAGGDDQVWPSVQHAEAIAERREQHGLATVVVTDRNAGHRTGLPGEPLITAGMRMARGGITTADQRLGRHAWPYIRALL